MIRKSIKYRFPLIPIIYDALRRMYIDIYDRCAPNKRLEKMFFRKVGYKLNLNNPRSYNEKIQWIKTKWHDPRLIQCMDKYAVREYVIAKGLGHILNDVIGVYESANDIILEDLPPKFVLKANHGSGWNIICDSKEKLNWKEEKNKLRRWLNDNFYYHGYEWGYLNIKPKILCEKFIETSDGNPLKDYKIFCFDGEPQMLFVASDRQNNNTKFDFYTCDWEYIPVRNHYPNSNKRIPRPQKLDELLDISKKLSEGFPHVRIDLYLEEDEIIFGEMTFGHFSGLHPFEPEKYDFEFGDFFHLPAKQL